jgi:hypothetical protein
LLPAGTLFNVYKKVNHASSFTQITDTQVNDLNKIFTTEVDINNANILQVKIAPTVSGNTAPEMESFDVMLNT